MEHSKMECYEEGQAAYAKGWGMETYPSWVSETDNGRYNFYMGYMDAKYAEKFPEKPKKTQERGGK